MLTLFATSFNFSQSTNLGTVLRMLQFIKIAFWAPPLSLIRLKIVLQQNPPQWKYSSIWCYVYLQPSKATLSSLQDTPRWTETGNKIIYIKQGIQKLGIYATSVATSWPCFGAKTVSILTPKLFFSILFNLIQYGFTVVQMFTV